MIHFEIICAAFAALNFGTLVAALWQIDRAAKRFITGVTNHITDTVNHAKDVVINNTDGVETQLEQFVAQQVEHSKQAVTSHLTEHAAELTDSLTKSVNAVEAHSKAVIDARGQQLGSTSVQRATCPQCSRVVFKFSRRADGTVFRCDDCAARG